MVHTELNETWLSFTERSDRMSENSLLYVVLELVRTRPKQILLSFVFYGGQE
jgi:hypothetical protein